MSFLDIFSDNQNPITYCSNC